MKFTPEETIFRFLFISPAPFVGAFDRDDFALTVVFPSFDRKESEPQMHDGPYARSSFMLSFEVPAPEKKLGSYMPMYGWVGEEASSLLGAFYGKLVLNAGLVQAGKFLTVPSPWRGPCKAHALPPFNINERKPEGPKLELNQAESLLAAYFKDSRDDDRLPCLLRAAEFYRMALENYDERPEMAFTLLISALESLVNLGAYSEIDLYDETLRSDLAAIEAECRNGAKIAARIKSRLHQVRRKVAALVDALIPDSFFIHREATADFLCVSDRKDLRERIVVSYDVRSRLLHTGDRSGLWILAHEHRGAEIVLGAPTMENAGLAELLAKSLNLTGLERVTATVLRQAIGNWLSQRLPVTSPDSGNVQSQ